MAKAKAKRCMFCRVSLDRHAAIAWDGFGSACVTRENKLTEAQRKDYADKLKPMWREWGRAFGGDPGDKPLAISSNGHGKNAS